MEEKNFRVVVVGGGTAGWLTALLLKHEATSKRLPVEISVIELSKIPTIGVGEGTTAVFRQALGLLGIDDTEFILQTGATVKLGIRHRDWLRKGHSYDGPIDDPNLAAFSPSFGPEEQASALHIYAVASGTAIPDIHLFGELMKRQKSPYGYDTNKGIIRSGPFEHAFHFDQARVGTYLRSKAKGVELIDDEVVDINFDSETGNICSLSCASGRVIEGDFFFDCTGFRKQLISQGLGAKWSSYTDTLPVNRAMPFWLELREDEEIAPFTLAWAQKAGWMWSIPTQDRIGCGYVYSDEFLSPEQAQEEIEQALGHKIEPRRDLRFDCGRLDRAWIGNCVALGLSSCFLEPLEATSIHGTIVQLLLFTQDFLKDLTYGNRVDTERYNTVVTGQLDDFKTFINMHYTGERDEPFWQHVRQNCMHKTTKRRMEHWSQEMPRRFDFPPFANNLPHINEQLYYPILFGLNHLSRKVAREEMAKNPKIRAHARKTADLFIKENRRIATKCMGHREYLDKIAEMTA